MATLRTVTVKSSGGDYTSLSSAESTEQGNMVSLDRVLKIECYSMSDTTSCVFAGWTTDATRYVHIYVPTAERHDGKWNSSKYRMEPSVNNSGLDLDLDDFIVDGIQVATTSSGTTVNCINLYFRTAGSVGYILNSIFVGDGSNNGGMAFGSTNSGTITAVNCIVYGATQSFFGGVRWEGGTGGNTLRMYNCTSHGNYYGFRTNNVTGTTSILKNCIASSPTGSSYAGTWSTGTEYCASSTATVPGVGSGHRASQTFSFVNAASGDFHLQSSDGGAKDFGVDLSGDSAYPFSTDIDGETRSGSWDMGADEYVAAGGPAKAVFHMHRTQMGMA